jgi:transposase-like protein
MRYTKEEKIEWVRLYKEGKSIATPAGVSRDTFKGKVRSWARLNEMFGPESLEHHYFDRAYTAEDKLAAVSRILTGEPYMKVANSLGMAQISSVLKWVRVYRQEGLAGLESMRKGRKPNMPPEKKRKLSKSEKEELSVLRARNEYLEAENEYLKKLGALVSEREQAPAKARKRVRSKNSEKKG